MKRIILIFSLLFSIIKADYLITNGEIALFYDSQNNVLENIRDRDIKKDLLANLQILLIKDYKVYRARNYYIETNFIEGRNIFKMKYFLEDKEFEAYIILSNLEKDNMYIYTNLKELGWKEPYELVYKFSPFMLTGVLEERDSYYKYGDINISKDKNSNILVATEKNLDNFKVKVLNGSLIKEVNERIYLTKEMNNQKFEDLTILNFNRTYPNFKEKDFKDIYTQEIDFWNKFNVKYSYLRKNVINQIKNFYLVSYNLLKNNSLIENTSRINYLNQLKVLYIESILNKGSEIPKLNFEKEFGVQNIYTYYYYMKLSQLNGVSNINNIFLKENLNKIRANIIETYKSILNKEGIWLDTSLVLVNFINEYQKIISDELILLEIKSIKDDIIINVAKQILDSKQILKSKNNIPYLSILSKDIQRKNIDSLLKDSNNSLGLVQNNKKVNYVENLNLSLLLYENNLFNESDKLFYNLDYFINSRMNEKEINLEEVFLYLKNIYYRGLI